MDAIIEDLNLDMDAQIAAFRQCWDVTQVRIATIDGTDIGWLQSFSPNAPFARLEMLAAERP